MGVFGACCRSNTGVLEFMSCLNRVAEKQIEKTKEDQMASGCMGGIFTNILLIGVPHIDLTTIVSNYCGPRITVYRTQRVQFGNKGLKTRVAVQRGRVRALDSKG